MAFPLFKDAKKTLQHWSNQLNKRFKELQEESDQYILNREVRTNSTWVDGSYIWRKVLRVEALPNTTTLNIAHNITSVREYVYVKGVASGGGYVAGMPHASASAVASQIEIGINGDNVYIVTGQDLSSYSGYVFIGFVK